MHTQDRELSKRRPVNLSIRADVLEEAKRLELNASKAAEAGIVEAVRQAKEQRWLEENKAALEAHNQRVLKEGLWIEPRLKPDE